MTITKIFNEMKFDADKCEDCSFLHKTVDPYRTGDSPKRFECSLPSYYADMCWLAVREFDNLKEQENGLQ